MKKMRLYQINLCLWGSLCQAMPLVPTDANLPVNTAPSGALIADIRPANAAGQSYNTYKEFNIPAQGLILNNALQPVQTQLAGKIAANPHLSRAATLIINEVIHPSPSKLQGMLEVAGSKAAVVITNPWGITCNGCGFINTSYAMLATGTVHFDTEGKLQHYQVKDGHIRIEGRGLQAKEPDYLTVLTRALTVQAEMHAQHLQVFLGANQLENNGTLTSLSLPSALPQYALDVGILGSMYANKIFILSTEKGAGIHYHGGLYAPSNAAVIDTKGDLTFGGRIDTAGLKLVSSGKITHQGAIKAPYLSIKADELITSPDSIIDTSIFTLIAKRTSHAGQIFVDKEANIYTQSLLTSGPIQGKDITLSVTQGYSNEQKLVHADKLTINKAPIPATNDEAVEQMLKKIASSGISAVYVGQGDGHITALGNIQAAHNGISAVSTDTFKGDMFIEAHNIVAGGDGIHASHAGEGAVNIKSTGTIISQGRGISVVGSGSINIEVTGDIIAGGDGVRVLVPHHQDEL
jgi:filamentous hemagglutinin family protein